jgi:hypothetical protein
MDQNRKIVFWLHHQHVGPKHPTIYFVVHFKIHILIKIIEAFDYRNSVLTDRRLATCFVTAILPQGVDAFSHNDLLTDDITKV